MKKRADLLVLEQGLSQTKEKAQALIMAGCVLLGTKRIEKSGELLDSKSVLTLKGKGYSWVSRGGLKLEKALEVSRLDVTDFVCMDVGCSTGGFTDVLLSKGAKKVYSVDVGYGQLAQKLRTDDRVVVLERTNARHLTNETIPEKVDLVVCDASFIRLQKVLPKPLEFTKQKNAHLIALIKPQFEVEKHQVGEKGVVRDPLLHAFVCQKAQEWVNSLENWEVQSICQSPIKGPEGNLEFLLIAKKKS